MNTETYRNIGGQSFTTLAARVIEVYTDSRVEEVDPGQIVTNSTGQRFMVGEMKLVGNHLYRITLIPVEVAHA